MSAYSRGIIRRQGPKLWTLLHSASRALGRRNRNQSDQLPGQRNEEFFSREVSGLEGGEEEMAPHSGRAVGPKP